MGRLISLLRNANPDAIVTVDCENGASPHPIRGGSIATESKRMRHRDTKVDRIADSSVELFVDQNIDVTDTNDDWDDDED